MAQLAQRAENEWVGVNCGIMDQMASAASQAGHALFIDCRTLETQPHPAAGGRGGGRAGHLHAARAGGLGL